MELISVIVPIYNVEKYLIKCIDSIISQTYKNLEIILIDDGSPDDCGQICDDYAQKDSRIVVIHKENGGLSDARNAGLDIMRGEYVVFVDSDDWVEDDYVKSLYSLIQEYNADISVSLVENIKSDNKKFYLNNLKAFEIILYGKYGFDVSACGKLYKSVLFDDLRFTNGEIFEDLELIPIIILNAQKVAFYQKSHYNYLIREGSIVRSKFNTNFLYISTAILNIKEYVIKHSYNINMNALKYRLFNSNLNIVYKILSSNDKNQFKYIINTISKDTLKDSAGILLDKNVRLISKIELVLFLINKKFFIIMYNAYLKFKKRL